MKNKQTIIFKDAEVLQQKDMKYIYVTSFEEKTVKEFYDSFMELESDPKVQVVPIVISSYGGQVYTLLSILDIMKTATKPIATICMGKAMSCGAVLLSSGTKGYRYAGENSTTLIHEVSSLAAGTSSEIQNSAAEVKLLNKKLMHILSENAGKKDKDFFIKALRANNNTDLYYSAAEAKSLGLIDYVSIPKLGVE